MPDFKVRFVGDLTGLRAFDTAVRNSVGQSSRILQQANLNIARKGGFDDIQVLTKDSGIGRFVTNQKTIVDNLNRTFVQSGDIVRRYISGFKQVEETLNGVKQIKLEPIFTDEYISSFRENQGNLDKYLATVGQVGEAESKVAAIQAEAAAAQAKNLEEQIALKERIAGLQGEINLAGAQRIPTEKGLLYDVNYASELKDVRNELADIENLRLTRLRTSLSQTQANNLLGPKFLENYGFSFENGIGTSELKFVDALKSERERLQQVVRSGGNPYGSGTFVVPPEALQQAQAQLQFLEQTLQHLPDNVEVAAAKTREYLTFLESSFADMTSGSTAQLAILEAELKKLQGTASAEEAAVAARIQGIRSGSGYLAAQGAADQNSPINANLKRVLQESKGLRNELLQAGLGGGAKFDLSDTSKFAQNLAKQNAVVTKYNRDLRTGVTQVSGSLQYMDALTGKVSDTQDHFTATIDKNGKVITRWGGQLAGAGNFLRQTVRDLIKVVEWTTATTVVFGGLGLAVSSLKTINDLNTSLTRFSITAQTSLGEAKNIFVDLGKVAIDTATPLSSLVKVADDIALATKNAGDSTTQWHDKIIQLTTAVGIFTNLTGEDTVQGADKLSSAFKQLSIAPKDLIRVLNQVTAVAGGQSTAINDIVTALGGVGEAGKAAQLTIEQQIALVQVLGQVTNKSAADTATAFKNLFGAISSPGSEKILKEFGIDIRDATGGLRPFLDIYRDINKAIESGVIPAQRVQDVLRGIAGGPRRAPDAAALLGNLPLVEQAIVRATNASNDALIANAKILDTNQAKITQLQNKFDVVLFQKFGDAITQATAGLTDALGSILDLFDKIDPKVISLLLTFGAILIAGKGLSILFRGFGGILNASLLTLVRNFVTVKDGIVSVGQAYRSLLASFNTNFPTKFLSFQQTIGTGLGNFAAGIVKQFQLIPTALKNTLDEAHKLSVNALINAGQLRVTASNRLQDLRDVIQPGLNQPGLLARPNLGYGRLISPKDIPTDFTSLTKAIQQGLAPKITASFVSANQALRTGIGGLVSTLAGGARLVGRGFQGLLNVVPSVGTKTFTSIFGDRVIGSKNGPFGEFFAAEGAAKIAGIGKLAVGAAAGVGLLTTALSALNSGSKNTQQTTGQFLELAGSISLMTGLFTPLGVAAIAAGGALQLLGNSAEEDANRAHDATVSIYDAVQKLKDARSNQAAALETQKDAKAKLDAALKSGAVEQATAATSAFVDATLALADANKVASASYDDLLARIKQLGALAGIKAEIATGNLGQGQIDELSQQLASRILGVQNQGRFFGNLGAFHEGSPDTTLGYNKGFVINPADIAQFLSPENLKNVFDVNKGGLAEGVLLPKNIDVATRLSVALADIASGKVKLDLNPQQLDTLQSSIADFIATTSSYAEAQAKAASDAAHVQALAAIGALTGTTESGKSRLDNANQRADLEKALSELLQNADYSAQTTKNQTPQSFNTAGALGTNVGITKDEVIKLINQLGQGIPKGEDIPINQYKALGEALLRLQGIFPDLKAAGDDALNKGMAAALVNVGFDVNDVAKAFGLLPAQIKLSQDEMDALQAKTDAFNEAQKSALQKFASRNADLLHQQQAGDFKGNAAGLKALQNQSKAAYEAETALNSAFNQLSEDGLAQVEAALTHVTGLEDATTYKSNELAAKLIDSAIAAGVSAKGIQKLETELQRLIALNDYLSKVKAIFHINVNADASQAIKVLQGLYNTFAALSGGFWGKFLGLGGVLGGPMSAIQAAINNLKNLNVTQSQFSSDINSIFTTGKGSSFGSLPKTGSSGGGGSSKPSYNVSTLDLPDEIANASNRSTLIQQAIKMARDLQSKIPGASKDAKNDIVELLKGTQRILEVRGIKDDYLRKALEELAAVEKKRLDFETKADTIRRIRVGSGSFAAIANVPVNSQTGVSVGSPNGPINVTLNLNGTVLTPAQLAQFADLVAASLKKQIANG